MLNTLASVGNWLVIWKVMRRLILLFFVTAGTNNIHYCGTQVGRQLQNFIQQVLSSYVPLQLGIEECVNF